MRDPRTTEAVAYGVMKAILDKAEEIMTRDPQKVPGLLERLKQRFQRRKP